MHGNPSHVVLFIVAVTLIYSWEHSASAPRTNTRALTPQEKAKAERKHERDMARIRAWLAREQRRRERYRLRRPARTPRSWPETIRRVGLVLLIAPGIVLCMWAAAVLGAYGVLLLDRLRCR